ncbi:MAG: hypothetical protein QOJ38_462 [Solirubrobacterales bacterium]|jgi:hypothetical protein|nr:hypothetical protein [Solirubrobacterales bacterium]
MSDIVLKEALAQLAAEAADRFGEMVRSGTEIPYEIDERPGEAAALYSYAPQTRKFIQLHAAELRRLPSFGPACAAIGSSGVASSYLEQRGLPVPSDERRRSEQLIVVFCEELWAGSEEFTLNDARLEEILHEIEFGSEEEAVDGVSVFCPLVGLQLPVTKLELATATIVRAEVTDLPPEALRSEGMGRAAWEPQYVAVARCLEGQQPAEVIGAQLREVITAMRLLQPGGVALGPYAWVHSADGGWRRISTGAARPRGGGYVLGESESVELLDLIRRLDATARGGPLAWSIARFEMGCERETIFDGLSDYLLALRGLLEGGGPAAATLPLRVAALASEPIRRERLRATVEHALALEDRLMAGAGAHAAADEHSLQVAADVEDSVRAILRDAARGLLGGDLRVTADEILVADGLSGSGTAADMGETSEWEPPMPPGPGIRVYAAKTEEIASVGRGMTEPDTRSSLVEELAEFDSGEETRVMQISEVVTPIDRARRAASSHVRDTVDKTKRETGVGGGRRYSVREIFPAPETTEWSIGELRFRGL